MHITLKSFMSPADNSRSFKKANGRYYNSLLTDMPLRPISMSAILKHSADVEIMLLDFNRDINVLDSFPYPSVNDCCTDLIRRLDYVHDVIGVWSQFSLSFHSFTDSRRAARA